jgi:hypothetical protein
MDLTNATADDFKVISSTNNEPSPEPQQNEPQPNSNTGTNNTEPEPKKIEPAAAEPSSPDPEPPVRKLEKNSSFDINSYVKEKAGYNSFDDMVSELGKLRDSANQSQSMKDDFIKGVVDYYNKTGDVTPYLEAKLVNYEKLSNEEILKKSLKEQYPTISDRALQALYQEQVVERFKLDPDRFDDLQVEVGTELLAAEAARLRSQYVERQNQFKAPDPVQGQNPAQPEADVEAWINTIKADPLTQKFMAEKNVSISYNGEQFNYEVDNPNDILDMTVDNAKFFNKFIKQDGQVDLQKWFRVVNYALDPETFERSLIAHGKTLGEEDVVSRRKNPSTPDKEGVRGGASSSDDFSEGLLKAFADRGRHIN